MQPKVALGVGCLEAREMSKSQLCASANACCSRRAASPRQRLSQQETVLRLQASRMVMVRSLKPYT